MSDNEINVNIGANASGVVEGMRAAAEAVETGTASMKGALAGVNAAFEAAMAPLIAFMAVLKGGQFIGEAISATVGMTKEAGAMSRQLGISANEAGQLAIALNKVHGTTEGYSAAATMLTRQIRSNEEGVKAMGLETRNADGSLKSSKDLMMDAITVLNGYKAGTDRNLAAQTLFGRGAANLGPILKLNNDIMEEAKRKQEELGLTITKEGQERVAKYRDALTEANEVMEAVKVSIGNALMPVLTSMGEWFASNGVTIVTLFRETMEVLSAVISYTGDVVKILWDGVVEAFTAIGQAIDDIFGKGSTDKVFTFANALKVIKTNLELMKANWEIAVDVIVTFIEVTVAKITQWANTIKAYLRLDFSGAQTAWNVGMLAVENRVKQGVDRIAAHMAAAKKAIEDVWNAKDGQKEHPADDGPSKAGKSFQGNDKSGGDDQRIKQWDNELAAQKLAIAKKNELNNTFYEMSKVQEAAYWAVLLERQDLTEKERTAIEAKRIAASLEAEKQAFEGKIAQQKGELESYKNNQNAKLAIAQQIASEMKQRFGAESKEYAQAAAEVVKIERAKADQIKAIGNELVAGQRAASLAAVDAAQAQSNAEQQMGVITTQRKLQLDQQYETQRHQIELSALNDQLALMARDPDRDPVAYAKLLDQKLALETAYQAKVQAIRTQATLEENKVVIGGITSMSQSWSQALAQMETGQANFATTVRSMWTGMLSTVTNALAKMIQDYLTQWMTAEAIKLGLLKTSGLASVSTEAALAGAGGVASMAASPFPMNLSAPAFGASMFAAAMSFTPAAAKGYDIPAGVNPVTQLHQKEMVLPQEQADVIRGFAANGGAGSGVALHIHAMDAQSFRGFLNNGGGREIMKHLNDANRNFRRA